MKDKDKKRKRLQKRQRYDRMYENHSSAYTNTGGRMQEVHYGQEGASD